MQNSHQSLLNCRITKRSANNFLKKHRDKWQKENYKTPMRTKGISCLISHWFLSSPFSTLPLNISVWELEWGGALHLAATHNSMNNTSVQQLSHFNFPVLSSWQRHRTTVLVRVQAATGQQKAAAERRQMELWQRSPRICLEESFPLESEFIVKKIIICVEDIAKERKWWIAEQMKIKHNP